LHIDYVKKLFEINMALSQEKNIYALVDNIVLLTRSFTHADAGTLYLREGSKLYFKVVQTGSLNINLGGKNGDIDWPPVELENEDGTKNFTNVSAVATITGKTIVIDDCYNEKHFDFSGTKKFDKLNGYRTKSMIVIPLKDFDNDVIGVIQLINKRDITTGEIIGFGTFDRESSIALASQATISILNVKLFEELEQFLERFMKAIGEAIDKKSPYTGNHVKKVATFVKLVTEAIGKDQNQYKHITYDINRNRVLEIASWLHDVGKISTPDHIMDKATKLEKVFDKIELIKERFEIIKRDVKIDFLENKISDNSFNLKISQLNDDFKFLQSINLGDIYMSEEKVARVYRISKYRYNCGNNSVAVLRDDDIENLLIKKGTLTESERDIIMGHARMTYKILKDIPFPKKFLDAKHIASNHHEKLNGKGYPRGLNSESLSLDDRILAISDVFEALSSGDRPYKKPKKLSDIFKILSFMVKDGDIDGDIVKLIFNSKVYLDYAKREMLEEQIDEPKLFF